MAPPLCRAREVIPVTTPALCPHGNPPGCLLCAAADAHPTVPNSPSPDPPSAAAEAPPTKPLDKTIPFAPPREAAGAPAALPNIPGYDVQGVLGSGGMGVVFKAWHQRLKRHVALKMIRPDGPRSRNAEVRFRIEAEAVARLQHPNIVQIHDIGEHDGAAYLALELVDGGSLDARMQAQPFAPRRAAELVETLARAVGHAHQRGVVHRDLKPANVLLADDGMPKITDFGLAKRVDEDASHTREGVVVGTPSYMAPEQARGRVGEIGPAADVYALGAILYELLAGLPPFRGDTTFETLKQVIHEEPAAPGRLRRGVPRDLEVISLKCLHKSPAKRYGTAIELAEDLRRWLDGEPIQARPAGTLERAAKWVRRRPAAAALLGVSLAAALALLAGGVTYSVRVRAERDRAEANLELAMRAVDDMLTEVAEGPLAYEPRMEEKRRRLLKKAQAMYLEFLQQKHDSPRIRFQTARASRRVADIHRLLGDYREADDAYDDAIRRFDDLLAGDRGNKEYRRNLAACWNWRGEARRHLGDDAGAEQAYDRAKTLYEQLVDDGRAPEDRRDLALAHMNLGILFGEKDRPAQADQQLAAAIALLDDLPHDDAAELSYRQSLEQAHVNRGWVLRKLGKLDDSELSYQTAIGILDELRARAPENPDYRHELGVAQNDFGNLLADRKRYDKALDAHAKAVAVFEGLAGDFKKVPRYRQEWANSLRSVGKDYFDMTQYDRAAEDWKRGAGLLRDLIAEHRDVPAYRLDRANLLENLGFAAMRTKDWPRAAGYFGEARGLMTPFVETDPKNSRYRQTLRDLCQNLAHSAVQQGDHRAAESVAQDLAKVNPDSWEDAFFAAGFVAQCVPLAGKDEQIPQPETREALERRYQQRAMVLLHEAIRRAGERHHEAFVERLRKEAGGTLQALDSLPEFQTLLSN
jgi:tetratricopeptide (TPR) repeat protein